MSDGVSFIGRDQTGSTDLLGISETRLLSLAFSAKAPGPHVGQPAPLNCSLRTPHHLSLTAGHVGLSLGMVITSPDGGAWRLHETWRAKLFEAESRYTQTRNNETKAEYLRVLKIFKDFVLYDIVPQG